MADTQHPTLPFHPTQSLNEIVAQAPQTLRVLQGFGLDTCCGGSLSLESAVGQHALELTTVLAALQEARRP